MTTQMWQILVQTEPWAKEDSLSVRKLIKHKPLIQHVLLSLCLQNGAFRAIYPKPDQYNLKPQFDIDQIWKGFYLHNTNIK